MSLSKSASLPSLKLDFLEYLELERNVSQNTIENYNHYLVRFLDFVGDIKPSEINLELIKKYRLHLARWTDPETKRPLKRKTQNYFMIALRAYLKYLSRIDVISLPPEKVELGESEDSPLKVLENKDLGSLLAAPDQTTLDGMRDRAILEGLFSTGLRVSELASLNRDSINFERLEFPIMGKGGKERIVFLSEAAAETIQAYLEKRHDSYKPLFIRFQGRQDPSDDGENMRLTTRSLERIVEKYVKQVGLTVKATPHTLRHSFATDLLVNGADIRSVQEMLGHANIATTQIYTHITNKQLREVHKSFHGKNKSD
jgi:site-specific recombinase XerD